jgi:hypothetical protein
MIICDLGTALGFPSPPLTAFAGGGGERLRLQSSKKQ